MIWPASPSSMPGVSVAMATYNGARFIHDQLCSLTAQTLRPDELVVSDDGSTDDTVAIIHAFAETAPFPVRILASQGRLGFGDNFLFAVENCRMEVVALCDQDDIWLPGKLAAGVGRLKADNSLLSMHRLTMTDEALQPIGPWNQGITGDRLWGPLELNPLSGWGNTMVFQRELASVASREERPWDPLYHRLLSHDTWLYILAAALGGVSHIAEPLILYRQHDGNVAGMRDTSLTERLRMAATVPLSTYRGRTTFYQDLAVIFDRIAARTRSTSASAAAAAERYRMRAARVALRARLYDDTTMTGRLKALARLQTAGDPDALSVAARALSLAKDVALGVTGWGYRL